MASRTIDGFKYEFQEFGAKESVKTLIRLLKIVARPLGIGLTAFDAKDAKKLLDIRLDKVQLAGAAEALLLSLDQDEVLDLVEMLSARDNVLCDGKKVNFNTHYASRLDHLMKVVAAALEVQYGNFIIALFGVIGKAPAPPASTQAP